MGRANGVGKVADLCVIGADLLRMDPHEIPMPVLMSVFQSFSGRGQTQSALPYSEFLNQVKNVPVRSEYMVIGLFDSCPLQRKVCRQAPQLSPALNDCYFPATRFCQAAGRGQSCKSPTDDRNVFYF